jgi:hypothetical protein
MISYIRTFQGGKFEGYNHNYGTVELTTDYGPSSGSFIAGRCSCANIPSSNLSTKTSQPIANFESLDKYIDFMASRLRPNEDRITNSVNGIGITKYYVCYWPKQNIKESYYDSNLSEFATLDKTLVDAFKLAGGDAGLNIESTNIVKNADKEIRKILEGISTRLTNDINILNNLNTTTTATPSCPPPTITSFTPSTGVTGTILTIVGTNLDTTTGITINNVNTVTGITRTSSTNISVLVPFSNTDIPQNNSISVKTNNGTAKSKTEFTYNPNQKTAAPPTVAPGIPPNTNTNPQQTGPIVLIDSPKYNTVGGTTNMEVTINPQAGSWDILASSCEWSWKAVKLVAGPNNTLDEEVVGSDYFSRDLEGYVSSNKKSFTVDDTDLLRIIEENIDDNAEFNKISRVYSKISLYAKPDITNSVKTDIIQTFPFNILIR